MALKVNLPEYTSAGQPVNNFRYPEDLQSSTQKAYVHIETYKEDPITINGLLSFGIKPSVKKAGQAIKDLGDKFADESAEQVVVTDADRGAVEGFINFARNASNNQDIEKKALTLSGERALLYLPVSLTYADGVTYDTAELGLMGAAAELALQAGAGVAGTIGSMVKAGVGTFVDALSGGERGQAAASLLATMALKKIPKSETLQNAAKVQSRVATNPNVRVMFKGVSNREFSFTFKLIATSKYEAEQIEGMIKWLRINMYPANISISGIAMGYQYPPRFMLRIMHRDSATNSSRDILNKIKPCYLKTVSTVYNSTQQVFHVHEDGTSPKPFEVDLTLSFMEAQQLDQKDIRQGY